MSSLSVNTEAGIGAHKKKCKYVYSTCYASSFPRRVFAFFNAKIPIWASFLNLTKCLVFSICFFFKILHILMAPKMQKEYSSYFFKDIHKHIFSFP